MVRKNYLAFFCISVCIAMELAASLAFAKSKQAPETTLLVVPARPRVVQLAFDLLQIRPVIILSYRGEARAADPLLFVWTKGEWQYVSADDFHERRFVSEWPRQVIVIGDDQILPTMLLEEAAWGADVLRLKTLQVADLINASDPVFRFKDREWRWLARRYDLNLVDTNEPRRTYNPYDIPRSKLPLAKKEFKQAEGEMPPAVLIESPEAETAALPEAPEEKPAKARAPVKEPSLK